MPAQMRLGALPGKFNKVSQTCSLGALDLGNTKPGPKQAVDLVRIKMGQIFFDEP